MKLTDVLIERMIEKRANANLEKVAFLGGGIVGAARNPRRFGTAAQNQELMNQGIDQVRNGRGISGVWNGIKNVGRAAFGTAYNTVGRNVQNGVLGAQKAYNKWNNMKLKGLNTVLDGAAAGLRAGHDVGLEHDKVLNKVVNTGLRGATAALDGAAKGSEALLNGSIAAGQFARGMGRSLADTAGQAANVAQRYGQQAVNSARRFGAGVGGFFSGLKNYYSNRGR